MIDDRNDTPMSHQILDSRLWNRTANLIGWNSYLEGRAGADDIPIYAAASRATVEQLAGLSDIAVLTIGNGIGRCRGERGQQHDRQEIQAIEIGRSRIDG